MTSASTKSSLRNSAAPDLSDFRKRFPLTVANFAQLAHREMWLERIWGLDQRWHAARENNGKTTAPEVFMHGAPPVNLTVEAEYEIIYAGGVLGLLHAAVMAAHYKRNVLVFDAHAVGKTHRDWNISDEELREFEAAGLFTKDEIEAAILNRYHAGFVKFHDAASRIKTPPLLMSNVLDVAVEADKLLALAAAKIRASQTKSALLDKTRFVRAYIQPDRVFVETEDALTNQRRLFAARLFIDATGTNSAVARQLNENHAITHVCPTVGTVARGFVHGEEPDQVNFNIGEILVST